MRDAWWGHPNPAVVWNNNQMPSLGDQLTSNAKPIHQAMCFQCGGSLRESPFLCGLMGRNRKILFSCNMRTWYWKGWEPLNWVSWDSPLSFTISPFQVSLVCLQHPAKPWGFLLAGGKWMAITWRHLKAAFHLHWQLKAWPLGSLSLSFRQKLLEAQLSLLGPTSALVRHLQMSQSLELQQSAEK